jgi:C_GCAxxG_C_C family probable redox protein
MKNYERGNIEEKAVNHFIEGFNCAEAVLMTFQEVLGLESDIIPRAATAFGGGIGLRGSICGAIMGGVMTIGLKHGRSEAGDTESLKRRYSLALELYERFKKRCGSAVCHELIDIDLTTREGRKNTVKM